MHLQDLVRLLEKHLEISGAYPHTTQYTIDQLNGIIRENPHFALPPVCKPLLGGQRSHEVCGQQGEVLPEDCR